MEAALTLAKRGFKTILFEAQDKLGGTANLAAIPPNKEMITEFVETMQAQLAEAGVDVRLGVQADLAALQAACVEAVFMAAGGKPVLPSKVGGNLYPSVVMHLAQEIMKHGGSSRKGMRRTAVEEGEVTIADAKTGEETILPADLVILAMGVRANRPDYEALREAYDDKLILVGDSCRPGQIYDALHSGHDKAFVY